MNVSALFFFALALLAAPFFSGVGEPRATQPDVVLPNRLDPWTEPTLRDEVRLNRLDIHTEPTLRDEVRLNQLDIRNEPTLRDEIVDEEAVSN